MQIYITYFPSKEGAVVTNKFDCVDWFHVAHRSIYVYVLLLLQI